jgi:hypothetical protein
MYLSGRELVIADEEIIEPLTGQVSLCFVSPTVASCTDLWPRTHRANSTAARSRNIRERCIASVEPGQFGGSYSKAEPREGRQYW